MSSRPCSEEIPEILVLAWLLLSSNLLKFEWHLRVACGYAELGMERKSLAELDAITFRELAKKDPDLKQSPGAALINGSVKP